MTPTQRFGVLLLTVGLGLTGAMTMTGCSSARSSKANELHQTLYVFHHAMRYARYDTAARYMKTGLRERFLGEYEERGEDYEILEIDIDALKGRPGNDDIIDAKVTVRWYQKPNMTIKKDKFIETWVYVDSQNWILTERELESVLKERAAKERAEAKAKREAQKNAPTGQDPKGAATPPVEPASERSPDAKATH